jgi:hypothetical protein
MERRTGQESCNVEEPRNGLVHSARSGGQNRTCDHGTAGRRAVGQRRVAEKDINAIERNASLRVRDLGKQSVGSRADILGGTAHANTAILAKFDTRRAGNACRRPRRAARTPPNHLAVALHRSDIGPVW